MAKSPAGAGNRAEKGDLIQASN